MAFYKGELKDKQGKQLCVYLALNKSEMEKRTSDLGDVDISIVNRKQFLELIKEIPYENLLCSEEAKIRYVAEAYGTYKFWFKTDSKAFFDCASNRIDYYTIETMRKVYNFRNVYAMYSKEIDKGIVIVGEFWEEGK